MKESLPLKTQHSLTLEKATNDAVSLAIQRKVAARQKANFGNSSSGYEFGGWNSLLANYIESPKPSPQDTFTNDSLKPDCYQNKVANKRKKPAETTLCPSAPADSDKAVVFGVVEGTIESPRVAYLDKSQPVTEEIQNLAAPVKPTEMMRIAASCQEKKCLHFNGSDCRLAQRIVQQLPSVTETLPACQIRSNCRWWQQEGKSACLRCPQVVTENYYTSPLFEGVAKPNTD